MRGWLSSIWGGITGWWRSRGRDLALEAAKAAAFEAASDRLDQLIEERMDGAVREQARGLLSQIKSDGLTEGHVYDALEALIRERAANPVVRSASLAALARLRKVEQDIR